MNHPGLHVPRPPYSPAQDRAEQENAAIGRNYPGTGDVIDIQRARYAKALAAGRFALEEIRSLEFSEPALLPTGTTADAEAGLYPLRDFPALTADS